MATTTAQKQTNPEWTDVSCGHEGGCWARHGLVMWLREPAEEPGLRLVLCPACAARVRSAIITELVREAFRELGRGWMQKYG